MNQRRNVKAKSKIPNNAENAQSNQSPTPSEIIANIKIFCWLVKNTSSSATVCGGGGSSVYTTKTQIQYFKV